MGLLLGVLLIPAIKETRREVLIVWIARLAAVTLTIVALVLTTKNFCKCAAASVWGFRGTGVRVGAVTEWG